MIRRVVLSLFAFAVLSAFGADPIYYFCEGADDGGYGYAWVSSPDDLSKDGYVFYPLEDLSEYWDNAPDSYMPYSDDPAYASFIPSNPPSGGGGSSSGGSDDDDEGESGGGSSSGGGSGGGTGGGGSSGGGSGGGGGGSSGGGGGGGSPDDGGEGGGGEGDPAVSGGGAGWDAFHPDDPLKSAEEGMSMMAIAVYSLLGVGALLVLMFLYFKLTKRSLNKVAGSGGTASARPYGRAYVSKSGRVYFYGRRK